MPSDGVDDPQTADALNPEEVAWVTATLIQDALRRGDRVDTYARVESIAITRSTAPGENYASVIYRVKAQLADGAGERSVLVKTLPKGSAMEKAVIASGIFRFEIDMLSNHIPEMKVLLDRASNPRLFKPFAARCLLHGSSPAPYIVLEDLSPQGFRLAERQKGLGLRHSLLALRALARFHGASAALLKQDPSVEEGLTNPMRGEGETWENFVLSGVQLSADVCRNIPGFEMYSITLEKFKDNAMDAVAKASDSKPGRFNAILHGDFWTNNMMFKYDDSGDPVDIRIVDFQLSHVSSPANDLLYFLYTSLSDNVFKNFEQLLLREYHNTLTETLNLFGIQGPSFKELMEDLDSHSAYALFGAFSVWPVARAVTVPDLNASMAGESSENSAIYECPSTKRWLQRVLPEFERRGWLKY